MQPGKSTLLAPISRELLIEDEDTNPSLTPPSSMCPPEARADGRRELVRRIETVRDALGETAVWARQLALPVTAKRLAAEWVRLDELVGLAKEDAR